MPAQPVESGQLCRRDSPCRQRRGLRLGDPTNLGNLADAIRGQWRHRIAPIGHRDDQPFEHEAIQGFAERSPRDTQLVTELALPQPFAGEERAGQDSSFQETVETVGQNRNELGRGVDLDERGRAGWHDALAEGTAVTSTNITYCIQM